jgi:phosphoglycerol transferase MdoB-like AlkP superfamily enzyme
MIKLPRLLKWVISIFIFFFVLLTAFRLLFYFVYKPAGYVFPFDAFIMGARIDLRSVCILCLFILLLSAFPVLHPFKNLKSRIFWNILLTVFFVLAIFFYVVDYFHFDYLHQRLNASVLNYLQDAGISLSMVWQTYPVIKIIILLILFCIAAYILSSRLLKKYQHQLPVKQNRQWIPVTVVVILLGIGTWGSLGQFSLRWSNVFSLGSAFKSQLALNPFQSFFSTLSFKNSSYDLKKVLEDYPEMATYLGVDHPDNIQLNHPDSIPLNYSRFINPTGKPGTKPNIILIICESFSSYKSSMWGNPLNTTPYFDSLCNKGIFFDRCFTPSYGTARGVWATITGIPDVQFPKTASRNPGMVDQNTIINSFEGYNKYYFLGGDANWANIRGLLKYNIKGLKLYEQDDYNAKKVDVWGVSDKNLFLNADKILSNEQQPFFAIIQTADNHRPYTIPTEDLKEFKKVNLPEDTLKKYGFISNDEFNAFRYTDFSYRKFIEAAQKSPYFKNTIFVFVGDHGIRGDAGNMLPKAWTEQALTTVHVPLLFYSYSLLSPVKYDNVCSQLDILPSVADLAGISFSNTTMGRDLFDSSLKKDLFRYSSAFIYDPDEKKIGMANNDFYLRELLTINKKELVSLRDNNPVPEGKLHDSLTKSLSGMAEAYYQTAKYLLYHNKKR